MAQQTPKQQYQELMINILTMVQDICEKYPVESQEYVEICNQFKNANIKFEDLMGAVHEINNNTYYRNYVANTNTNTRNSTLLTDEEKSRSIDYKLCECGCYIHKYQMKDHIKTDKHYKLIRNKKFVHKKKDTNIDDEINIDTKLSALMLKKQKEMEGQAEDI